MLITLSYLCEVRLIAITIKLPAFTYVSLTFYFRLSVGSSNFVWIIIIIQKGSLLAFCNRNTRSCLRKKPIHLC